MKMWPLPESSSSLNGNNVLIAEQELLQVRFEAEKEGKRDGRNHMAFPEVVSTVSTWEMFDQIKTNTTQTCQVLWDLSALGVCTQDQMFAG